VTHSNRIDAFITDELCGGEDSDAHVDARQYPRCIWCGHLWHGLRCGGTYYVDCDCSSSLAVLS
jgi:hypothetical protein